MENCVVAYGWHAYTIPMLLEILWFGTAPKDSLPDVLLR